MTHADKLKYMSMALALNNCHVEPLVLDMLVSTYDLVKKSKGNTTIHQVVELQLEVRARYPEAKHPEGQPEVTAVPVEDKPKPEVY